MSSGFKSYVKALLQNVDYTADHLAQKDENEETALHALCCMACSIDCARLVLFSPKLNLGNLLNHLVDERVNNILSVLACYTNLPYHDLDSIRTENCSSETLQLSSTLCRAQKTTGRSCTRIDAEKMSLQLQKNVAFIMSFEDFGMWQVHGSLDDRLCMHTRG